MKWRKSLWIHCCLVFKSWNKALGT
jgi:hypothetical protein